VFGRIAVALFTLTIVFGTALPAFARVVSGPKAHVCHCETGKGHAHCDCPICFPDREVDLLRVAPTLGGRCGDDETGWRTWSDLAVPPLAIGIVVACETELPALPAPRLRLRPFEPPDPRPPRLG
jgi:hypothetical protein